MVGERTGQVAATMTKDWAENLSTAFVYIGGIVILVWALLKSAGIIHSPVWVDMVPYYAVGISFIAFTYKAGRFTDKIEQDIIVLNEKVDKLANVPADIIKINTRCAERHPTKPR